MKIGDCQRCNMSGEITEIHYPGFEIEELCLRCYSELDIMIRRLEEMSILPDIEDVIWKRGKKIKITMWD